MKILIEEKFIAAYHRAAHRVSTIHFLFLLPRQLHLRLFTRETLSCKISIFIYFDANIYINELKEIILHVSLFLLFFFLNISKNKISHTIFENTPILENSLEELNLAVVRQGLVSKSNDSTSIVDTVRTDP